MNINHLIIFKDLAQTLNYTQTAEHMGLTQPAITKSIKSLESELNITLFKRTKSQVSLTKSGEYFYHEIIHILQSLDSAISQAKSIEEREFSVISVAYSGTMLETLKFKEFKQFTMRHPDITIYLENYTYNELKKKLVCGECDMIFGVYQEDWNTEPFEFYPLETGHFSVILAKSHPLSKKKKITCEDLINEPMIYINSKQCFLQLEKVQNHIRSINKNPKFYYADSFTLAHSLVKSNLGIAILPDFLEDPSQQDVTLIPFDSEHEIKYGITIKATQKKGAINTIIKEIVYPKP